MERRIWTAAELDGLSPDERNQVFEGSINYALDEAPADLVARARTRLLERIAREGALNQ